jgi:hypothetical protein
MRRFFCDWDRYQDEAQAFYQDAGGPEVDYFWLDDDADGIACEALPSYVEAFMAGD